MSHLLQMRGLKRKACYINYISSRVASFTDAWIETSSGGYENVAIPSHLLQMRGLKPDLFKAVCSYCESHLLQMRGLKLPVC